MKKTYLLLLSVLLAAVTLRASAQDTASSKENFPTTEKTLAQIGQADTHPNAKHIQQPDTSALAAVQKRPGLIRRIIDYYSRSNVDRTFEKKIDWSIAPGPNYSSDVGFGIGFLLAGLYRLDRTDSITAPSNISIYGNFTTEKFVLLRFSGDNIYHHNKQRLSYSGAFVYFPGAFYGVGYEAGKEGYAQDLTTTMGIFRISYCTALVGRFYIGISGGIDYTGAKYKDSGMADYMQRIDNGEVAKPGGQVGEMYDLWKDGKRYDPEKQDLLEFHRHNRRQTQRLQHQPRAFRPIRYARRYVQRVERRLHQGRSQMVSRMAGQHAAHVRAFYADLRFLPETLERRHTGL